MLYSYNTLSGHLQSHLQAIGVHADADCRLHYVIQRPTAERPLRLSGSCAVQPISRMASVKEIYQSLRRAPSRAPPFLLVSVHEGQRR